MALERLEDATVLMHLHFSGEAYVGFPRLSRIPSSGAIRTLDHFAGMTAADRDPLLELLARTAAMQFFPPHVVRDQMMELLERNPLLLRRWEALRSPLYSMGLRYAGLRMRKSMMLDPMSMEMMAKTRATLDFTPRDDMPPELVPDPDPANLKPATAPLLRKLIDAAFKELFAPQKKTLPGGTTGYTGVLQGTNITVWIDYAGAGMQLLYGVSIPDETKRLFVERLAYEDLWGAGRGWDYLTQENAEGSIRLLCELIANLVQLRNTLMSVIG